MTTPQVLRRCGLPLLLATTLSAHAQLSTWNNSGTNWSSAGSWTNGVPDSNVEKPVFGNSGAPQNPFVDGTFTIQGITFGNSTTTSYTLAGSGTLIIDANTAGATNTIQINGNQTFNVDISTTNSNVSAAGQRFVIGTNTGTLNFGAGHTLTVGAGGVSLQGSGAGSGAFNFYGTVNLGANALTQQATATPVYFREGSSLTSTTGVLSNSAGNMYFETDNINLGGSAAITMFGSLLFDAGLYLSKDGLNISENVRVANTGSGFTRTVGVDITGSGTATWSGNVNISDTGTDIVRTVKFSAGTGDRANFSGNIVSTNALTDAVQIDGGGTVVFSGTGNTYISPTTVNAGTVLLANNSANSATGANSVTVAGTLGGTGRIAPGGANGLTVNSGGVLAPGDGGIESLEVNLASTTGTASFLSGATFTFDLNAPGNSDVLSFTGLTASSSDVTFNGNVINFTDLGSLAPGLYTLFTFDANNAYTGVLAIGTGLGSYTGELIYNANSIQLNVIPEPAVSMLVMGGLGAMFLRRRRSS